MFRDKNEAEKARLELLERRGVVDPRRLVLEVDRFMQHLARLRWTELVLCASDLGLTWPAGSSDETLLLVVRADLEKRLFPEGLPNSPRNKKGKG